MRRILKIAAIVISLSLAGILAVFLWKEKQTEKENQARSEELERELRPLEVERNRLRQELDALKTEHKNSSKGVGSVVLVFTDLSETVYTDIFPQMREHGFSGVLAISGSQAPGREGCLSKGQFQELVNAGWTYCLKWEAGAEPEAWLGDARAALQETEIAEPEAVYFPADTYSGDLGRFLKKENFSIAVHHGEEGLPVVATKMSGGIWYPGAVAWNQQKSSNVLAGAISQRGDLVFTVGSDSDGEQYESETFLRMLGSLRERCKKEELMVTNLEGARGYRAGIEEEQKDLKKKYQEEEMELEERIDDLGEEIDAVTRQYIAPSQ